MIFHDLHFSLSFIAKVPIYLCLFPLPQLFIGTRERFMIDKFGIGWIVEQGRTTDKALQATTKQLKYVMAMIRMPK